MNVQSLQSAAGVSLVRTASKEKVLDALGGAASKLHGELGESLATLQKFDVPLEQATTSSLEALKAYSLGAKAIKEKGIAASLPYDQRAIELDPNFAMGYAAMAGLYYSLGEVGRASEYQAKAFQLRDHASEREKLGINAFYYENVTGELDKAAKAYQEEIENYPRAASSYGNLGGRLFGGSIADAFIVNAKGEHYERWNRKEGCRYHWCQQWPWRRTLPNALM